MRKKLRIKKPKCPRCLCRNYLDWVIGRLSPSLCFIVNNEETRKFWYECNKYERFQNVIRKRELRENGNLRKLPE